MTQHRHSPRKALLAAASVLAAYAVAGCETVRLNPAPPAEISADKDDVVDRREIVVLVNTASASDELQRKSWRLGYRLKSKHVLPELDLVLLTFTIPNGMDGGSAIRELEALEAAATAGVNHGYTVQADETASSMRHYANKLIGWPSEGCPAQRRIGVIDAGIGAAAERFTKARITERDFTTAEPKRSDHGETITALIAGDGRLTDASIYLAGVISDTPQMQAASGVDRIVLALDWLLGQDVDVINISLAGPYNKILDRAFDQAAKNGVVIVAAGGNAGPSSPPRYPAAFASVIAVTAVNADGALHDNAVRGPHIDFAAPGVDIAVPPPGVARYTSGTSIAAPFVTARIAADASLVTVTDVRTLKSALAQGAVDLGPQGPDPEFGLGLITTPPGCGRSET